MTKELTAKLSLAACTERGIAPARKHIDRMEQLAKDDENIATRATIARRIGAQGHEGQPTARVRAYRLTTRLNAWLASGAADTRLYASDPVWEGSKTAKNGSFDSTNVVRNAIRTVLADLAIPSGMFVSIGDGGQIDHTKTDSSGHALPWVTLRLKVKI